MFDFMRFLFYLLLVFVACISDETFPFFHAYCSVNSGVE